MLWILRKESNVLNINTMLSFNFFLIKRKKANKKRKVSYKVSISNVQYLHISKNVVYLQYLILTSKHKKPPSRAERQDTWVAFSILKAYINSI